MATWTKTEETTLLTEIKTIKSISEIAKKHNRTPNAIQMRLHRIISRSVLAGTQYPIEDIKTFLKQKPRCETQLTITSMFKETFDREKLRGLQEKRRVEQLTHFIDTQIANHVVGNAAMGNTSFLYERNGMNRQHEPTDEDLVVGLQMKFPGSSVAWVEEWVDVPHYKRPNIGPPTRTLKKGIKIDWS